MNVNDIERLARDAARTFHVGDDVLPLLVNVARLAVAHVSASYDTCQQSSSLGAKSTP